MERKISFDDIKVSTRTFTANTNICIDLDKVFDVLPITHYVVIPPKRGPKSKTAKPDPNKNISYGSIVTVLYRDQIRGVRIKPKKKKSKQNSKWFRNSMTIVIMLGKPVNFKICKNGTFQMTGCKTQKHADDCIKFLWEYIKDQDVYKYNRTNFLGKNSFESLVIPCMRNIDFSLGFNIDREKLHSYIMSVQRDYRSMSGVSSMGYTGVNIKTDLSKNIRTLAIKRIYTEKDEWKYQWTTYEDYLTLLSPKEVEDKVYNKERHITFLVFQSGEVIMSGLTADFMRDEYYKFMDLIKSAKGKIEERLLKI